MNHLAPFRLARLFLLFLASLAWLVPPTHAAAELVSISTGGDQTSQASQNASTSSDGRFVAFDTADFHLVANDNLGNTDVFLRDRSTGETLRLTFGLNGQEADGNSSTPAVSGDGRHIAYTSDATNLVPGDTNGFTDIFVYNRLTKKTERASVRTGGGQALGGNSYFPAISGNGRFVAFMSDATNLVPNDTNGLPDVFVHDLLTKVTTRVSIRSDGNEVFSAPGFSAYPSLSFDGRYVAFPSNSTDLVDGDNNGVGDIFVHDRAQKTTTIVSRNSAGVLANAFCNTPSLSADGQTIAFISTAGNLDGAGGSLQVYARDLRTGVIKRVRPAATYSFSPSISADGRRVALTDKVGGASEQVEVVDLNTGKVFQPARSPSGTDLGSSGYASLSADGRVVSFQANVDGFDPTDSNGAKDIIARPLFDTVGFSQSAYYVSEANGVTNFPVHREGLLNGAVSLNYVISAGGDTAKANTDYSVASKTGTLSWAANDLADKNISATMLNTSAADGYRFFTISLTNATTGVSLGTPATKVVIRDNESDPVENRIGHRLQITKVVSLGTNWDTGLFRARLTLRNPAALPSFNGFVELRLEGVLKGTINFASVPARGEFTFDASCNVNQFPSGKLFATLFENTPDLGAVKQDSALAAGYINNGTAPPSGGTSQPNTGVKAPGPPPVVVKSIAISGSATVDEGTFADYTATVTLSDNTTLANVTPSWSASAFSINGAGRFTAGDVAANKPVTLTARVVRNGVTSSGSRSITVKNVPATPIITSAATAFASRDKPFSYRITARHEPTSFTATNLPDGLSVNPTTGFITGTPTVSNTFNSTISATNVIGTDSNALTITVSDPSPLTITINGTGTVTPDLNGQSLDVGKTFFLKAKPGAGQLFNGWTGGVVTAEPAISFVMTPNLAITANFVANPFLARTGSYAGLVQSTPPTHDASGYYSATVSKTGLCTGKITIGGKTRAFKTQLKPDGTSPLVSLPVPGLDPIQFLLGLDVVGMSGNLNGLLTIGPVSSTMSGSLVNSDTSSVAGRYTVLLPGPNSPSPDGGTPDGSGYATVVVPASGKVKLVGLLGDGTPISLSTPITVNGNWPVFAPLYATHGSILGFATFSAQANSDFAATLAWFKPERPADAFYPQGWPAGLSANFLGAKYLPPPVLPGLTLPDGDGNSSLTLTGGGLLGSISQPLNLNDNGTSSKVPPVLTGFSFSINATTGIFKGTALDPVAGKVRLFSGAIQQKLEIGGGVFKGASQRAGQAVLDALP